MSESGSRGVGGMLVHSTTIAFGDRAVMLRGPSGAGKSDLALRFLAAEGQWPLQQGERRLIADDQTRIDVIDGRLRATAPASLSGKIEVRGIGIVECAFRESGWLSLVVDLVPPDEIERLPDERIVTLLGVAVRLQSLAPFEASAVAKLGLMALEAMNSTEQRR